MRIAVAWDNGDIGLHFGHADCFAIYNYEDGDVSRCTKTLVPTDGRHGHQAMAELMQAQNVDAVISGNMGGEAKAALLSLGIEIKVKTDPGYCRPAIRQSPINHLLNPLSVARVAATYSARESEMVTGISEELGAEVISFDAEQIANANAPMSMTFNPEKKNDTATALSFLASSEGSIVIRRATSAKGLVFSAAMNRDNIILPE